MKPFDARSSSASVYSEVYMDDYVPDYNPAYGLPTFLDRSPSPTPSSFGSTDESSSMSGSRAPSIYSYSSSRNGTEMLRESEGRTFNAQNDVYYLPADEPEFDRLGLQHRIHSTVLGGLYPGPEVVQRVLAPEWGVEKAVLDVGTGPGHWAIDMANEFPHVHVVGVDLAPRTSIPVLPPNLRLEFDDANLGFPHYYNCFDLIHARSISTGINDYEGFIMELEKCLRPGGVLIIIDGEPPILNHLRMPLPPAYGDEGYPAIKGWFSRVMHEAAQDMTHRGGRVLTNSPVMVENALNRLGKLYPAVVHTMFIPLGPWPVGQTPAETKWIRTVGEMMRRNAYEFLKSLRPTLKSRGFNEAGVDRLITGAQQELADLSIPMYTRWVYAYAEKPRVD